MRFALAALAAAALLGTASAASATEVAPPPPPVGVSHGDDGSVCVWISYQVPHCTPGLLR